MMAFPSSLLTLRVLLLMQGILQAFVFVLWIDCPPIGLEINNCRIAIHVPGGSFQPKTQAFNQLRDISIVCIYHWSYFSRIRKQVTLR